MTYADCKAAVLSFFLSAAIAVVIHPKPRIYRSLLIGALLAAVLPGWSAAAHETAVEVSGGTIVFTDTMETFGGGAARFYVKPRISLGPEITFIQGRNHTHWMATGNVTFDFVNQQSGRRFIPFVLAGGGLFQTRERFTNQTFISYDGAFTAGPGFRVLIGERFTLGGDVRVGWELHVRVGATLGIRLGN